MRAGENKWCAVCARDDERVAQQLWLLMVAPRSQSSMRVAPWSRKTSWITFCLLSKINTSESSRRLGPPVFIHVLQHLPQSHQRLPFYSLHFSPGSQCFVLLDSEGRDYIFTETTVSFCCIISVTAPAVQSDFSMTMTHSDEVIQHL